MRRGNFRETDHVLPNQVRWFSQKDKCSTDRATNVDPSGEDLRTSESKINPALSCQHDHVVAVSRALSWFFTFFDSDQEFSSLLSVCGPSRWVFFEPIVFPLSFFIPRVAEDDLGDSRSLFVDFYQ